MRSPGICPKMARFNPCSHIILGPGAEEQPLEVSLALIPGRFPRAGWREKEVLLYTGGAVGGGTPSSWAPRKAQGDWKMEIGWEVGRARRRK